MADKVWVAGTEMFDDLLTMEPKKLAAKYGITEQYAKTHKSRVIKRITRRMARMERDPNYEPSGEHLEEMKRLQELLQDFKDHGLPIGPEDASSVSELKIWQMGYTDSDGDGHVQTLRGATLKPALDDHEHDIIREAPPVIVKPAKVTRTKSKDKRAIIVPDLQGGYRRHGEELEPIHDESVVDVGLQIIRHAQPDLIVLNGDNLDFGEISHYLPDSDQFQQTMQATVDRVHEILAQMRASAPNAEIVWLEGNHEKRLSKQILKHNAALWGVKRPGTTEDHPWMSVGHLMNLDDIDVKYLSGYPANTFQINDRLQAVHGDRVRSNGSTAPVYASQEELSTIYGHVHRREAYARTNRLGRVIMGLSYGTWARTDGAVPSFGNGIEDDGRVVPRQENWQNGLGFIQYQEGDKPFQEQFVHIDRQENYETSFDGKTFKPSA